MDHSDKSVPLNFKPGPRKTLEVVRTVVNAAYGSLSGPLNSSDNVPFVDEEIVKEDAPWDFL